MRRLKDQYVSCIVLSVRLARCYSARGFLRLWQSHLQIKAAAPINELNASTNRADRVESQRGIVSLSLKYRLLSGIQCIECLYFVMHVFVSVSNYV